jgi:hypothetical protein
MRTEIYCDAFGCCNAVTHRPEITLWTTIMCSFSKQNPGQYSRNVRLILQRVFRLIRNVVA